METEGASAQAGLDTMKLLPWIQEVGRLLQEVALLRRENELLTEQLQAEIDRKRNHDKWWDESLVVGS